MGDKSVLVPKKIWIVLGKEHQIHKSELKCGECTPQLKPSAVDPRENNLKFKAWQATECYV